MSNSIDKRLSTAASTHYIFKDVEYPETCRISFWSLCSVLTLNNGRILPTIPHIHLGNPQKRFLVLKVIIRVCPSSNNSGLKEYLIYTGQGQKFVLCPMLTPWRSFTMSQRAKVMSQNGYIKTDSIDSAHPGYLSENLGTYIFAFRTTGCRGPLHEPRVLLATEKVSHLNHSPTKQNCNEATSLSKQHAMVAFIVYKKNDDKPWRPHLQYAQRFSGSSKTLKTCLS